MRSRPPACSIGSGGCSGRLPTAADCAGAGRGGRSSRVEDCKPPAARDERTGRDLAVELAAPPAGDRGAARRAAAVGRDAILADVIAVTRDQQLVARGAARVLEVADLAGQIAGVD